jgi:uncharacterized LabA/DUF88 family protein
MLFYPQEKLALFIDGANLYGAAKGLQFDIDYKRLLELFARKGKRVSVVSTFRTSPPMVADELRRQADNFIELDDLKVQIAREGAKTPQFVQSA